MSKAVAEAASPEAHGAFVPLRLPIAHLTTRKPRVTIGMPVYNGARYLPGAIESILSQTFTDFELVICDNASTDQTQWLCTAYAARDARIRYHRNEKNIGAAGNFNLAFKLARGEFFKWAAHDDLHSPDYLAKCVELLDADPKMVLAHTNALVVDGEGREVPVAERSDDLIIANGVSSPAYLREHLYDPERALDSTDPAVRLRELLTRTKWCFEIFGLMRSSALGQTPLHLTFYGSDKVLLAAMALQGRFGQVSERMFLRRHHMGQSSSKSTKAQALWMGAGGKAQYVPPQLRCFQWYIRLIARSGLPLGDRIRCFGSTGRGVAWLIKLILAQRNERGFLHRLTTQLSGRE